MNNQKQITALIKAVSGQANILTIPRLYIDLLDGDIVAALFLSQCVYWSDRTKNPEGWFYKTAAEWTEETGLSRYQLDRSLRKTADFVEKKIKRADGAPTAHYRVDMDFLTETICEFLEVGFDRNLQMDLRETDKSDLLETDKLDLRETDKSLTKTTRDLTEITTERGGARPNFRDISMKEATDIPEIGVIRAITAWTPPSTQYEIIYDAVQQVMETHELLTYQEAARFLQPFWVEWVGRGYNHKNLAWLREWAMSGEIPDGKPNTQKPTTTRTLEGYEYAGS